MTLARRSQHGFVLVATIWVLAAMTLFIGFVSSAALEMQDDIFLDRQEMEHRLAQLATESVVLYLGSTQPVTYAGLTMSADSAREDRGLTDSLFAPVFEVRGDETRLDGRTYRGVNGTRFTLQDTGSLISLRIERPFQQKLLAGLLEKFDVSPAEAALLVSRLLDYIDRDNERSLDGLERRDYIEQNYLPPTNRFLRSPTQLLNVPGWKTTLGGRLDEFLEEVTVGSGNRPNFNTMRSKAMELHYNLPEEAINRVLSFRNQNAYRSMADIDQVAGVVVPSEVPGLMPVPDSLLRLKMWHTERGGEQWVGIRFTPLSGHAPWEIDYRLDRSLALTNISYVSIDPIVPESDLFR